MRQSKKTSSATARASAGVSAGKGDGKAKSKDKAKVFASGENSAQTSAPPSAQTSPQTSSQTSAPPSAQSSAKPGGESSYNRISNDKAWRKIKLATVNDSTPENLLAADRLLRMLNSSYFQLGGREWKCTAKIVTTKNPLAKVLLPTRTKEIPKESSSESLKESSSESSSQIQKQPQAIVIACGGANYLLEAAMPIALRQVIEKMTEPFQLEEIPQAIALGIVSFKLKPSLQQLLALSAEVKDYFFATTTTTTTTTTATTTDKGAGKARDKEACKVAAKNRAKWLQQCDLAIDITALPAEAEKQEQQPKQQQNNSRMPFEFRLHLACANAIELCAILQPTRSVRHYPPNLHINWSFHTTSTTISLEELRDLEEGDVLMLT